MDTDKKQEISVLYIDDEENNLNAFKANFRRDFKIYTAISAELGLELLRRKTIHIILTDQRMPKMTGVEFLESIIKEFPDPIRILITGYTDVDGIIDAINKGQVYKYITKPWNSQELKVNLENAYEVYALREENKQLIKSLLTANEQLEFLLRQKLLS